MKNNLGMSLNNSSNTSSNSSSGNDNIDNNNNNNNNNNTSSTAPYRLLPETVKYGLDTSYLNTTSSSSSSSSNANFIISNPSQVELQSSKKPIAVQNISSLEQVPISKRKTKRLRDESNQNNDSEEEEEEDKKKHNNFSKKIQYDDEIDYAEVPMSFYSK